MGGIDLNVKDKIIWKKKVFFNINIYFNLNLGCFEKVISFINWIKIFKLV